MKKIILGIVIVIVVLIGVKMLWYSNSDITAQPTDSMVMDDSSSPMIEASQSIPVISATVDAGATTSSTTKDFTVTGTNFSFSPSTLTVKKGDTVNITFKNASGFHDFKIDEFKVATKRINGGAQEVVSFVADKTGTFEYYCSVGSHRAMGMKGALTVTE